MTAHLYVRRTMVMLCHRVGATPAKGCLGGATVVLGPGGCTTTAYLYVGGTTVVLCQ